jgi:hypothetical protein
MIVDRWPTEFVYASRRILGDIVSQNEASRGNPFRMGKLKGGFAGFGAEAERRPAESNEIYALIRRATGYISDFIDTLDDPELAPYVRAKIHLFSQRVRRWAVWEEKYTTGHHREAQRGRHRGLWQVPDPELITQLQQIYLDVEGDLEDM